MEIFYRKKISNNITIAGGGIYYGVDKIEEYNDLAQFEGFITLNSGALLLGISNKVESFHTGLGLNFISENYSNIEDSDNAHIGVDFGLSFIDMQPIRGQKTFLSLGMTNKSIIYGTDKVNSSYSTTSGFIKLSNIINLDTRSLNNVLINGFIDFSTQTYIKRHLINSGMQFGLISNSGIKLLANLGISNMPILSEGTIIGVNILLIIEGSFGFSIEGPMPKLAERIINLEFDPNSEFNRESKLRITDIEEDNSGGSLTKFIVLIEETTKNNEILIHNKVFNTKKEARMYDPKRGYRVEWYENDLAKYQYFSLKSEAQNFIKDNKDKIDIHKLDKIKSWKPSLHFSYMPDFYYESIYITISFKKFSNIYLIEDKNRLKLIQFQKTIHKGGNMKFYILIALMLVSTSTSWGFKIFSKRKMLT